MTRPVTFRAWLRTRPASPDPAGEYAIEAIADPALPDVQSWSELSAYLTCKGGLLLPAHQLWAEFEAARDEPLHDALNSLKEAPGWLCRHAMHVQRLPHAEGLPLPSYATDGASGMDLLAAVSDEVEVYPGQRSLIPTGLAFAVPPGFEVQIRSRSGLALKQGLVVANSPGTIDSDYRGEVQVILLNVSDAVVRVTRGMRIAQAVMAPVIRTELLLVDALDETARGAGGFGSTGQ